MKKFIVFILIILFVTGGAVLYILLPKSLGVSYTFENLNSAQEKINVNYESIPQGESSGKTILVSGSHAVDETFTSEEISALADNRYKDYAYFPFRNVQIKVNNDGTVEGSATVNYKDAVSYLLTLGVSSNDITKAVDKFKIPNASLPVYMKVSGNINYNESFIDVENVQIAKISVPKSYIEEYTPALNSLVESIIKDRSPSYEIKRLEVVDGKIHFQGSAPDTEQAVKRK